MVGISKNILRAVLVVSYIAITVLIIFGISSVYSYLNTGADRSKMLHTEIKKIDQYLPKVVWNTITNEGRPMEMETLKAIENDYLDAWYVKQVAYKTNTTIGIDDYYTESARINLYRIVEYNSAENTTIESTSLEHHPTLEFYSEDGQLAVITDHDVIEYKHIYRNSVSLLETREKSTYKIVLLLEDGFWRIRHIVKQTSEIHDNEFIAAQSQYKDLTGINYYPQGSPWDMYGENFDAAVIARDMKIIKDAGLFNIRVFVPYEDFGKANVDPEKIEKLVKILNMADDQNIKVMLTLFDFYGDYSVLDWTLNQRHAETLVSALKGHNALLAWDVKNEPDLDFKSRGKEKVFAWLDAMVDIVKFTDPDHPVTIGWSKAENANLLSNKLDIISFHYYEDINDLDKTYKNLKSTLPNKPLVITEFGVSSYKGLWNPLGSSESDQAAYHKKAQGIFQKNSIQSMSWTLYDFVEIPKEVVGRLPWRQNAQKHFGFIDKNGAKKEAFEFISQE